MIEINHLTKRFGAFTAVDDLSFTVQPGEVLGFLGPNGAGKSTTMKMIAGFLHPSAGTINVFGENVLTNPLAVKQKLGYLPEGAPSYGEMTVHEFLRFIADIRGLRGAERQQRIDHVIEQVQLQAVLHKTLETLSKGYGRRVGIAQAILHNPPVLIMDEPTDGLDPNQKHEVRKLIQTMAHDKTIIVSTHILEEVDAVCSRAIIIANGKICADGTPAELASQSRYHQAVTIRSNQLNSIAEQLRNTPAVIDIELNTAEQRVTAFAAPGQTILPTIQQQATAHHWDIQEMVVEKGRLDEVFRNATLGATQETVSETIQQEAA